MANPLKQLADVGQSFWLDNLSRDIIVTGELERLIREDGLRGITSNPTIFEKALAGTDEYDQDIRRLSATSSSPEEVFEALALADIRQAADLLRIVYDGTEGSDGFVSLELPPYLATDTERSVAEAKRLFAQIDRPNVMIKVPGTHEGIPAIEDLIAAGVNVNITLLFSIPNYEEVMEAYLRGIERRVAEGKPVDQINSVASFFVSRVDTAVDHKLDQMIDQTDDPAEKERLASFRGKVAIANAKIAYQRFKKVFLEGERFRELHEKHGARIQRPLWASTSTKNPEYSDVLYIEALIGPHTVETMAPVSVDAFRDHGTVRVTLEEGVEEAQRILDELGEIGIDYDEVTKKLQVDGVAAFEKSYQSLLEGIAEKQALLVGPTGGRPSNLGPFEDTVQAMLGRLEQERFVERLWQRDPSLWSDDEKTQARIANRLGWLDSHEAMQREIQRFSDLAIDIQGAGFSHALLLGMGGSSLAPEVFQRTFGNADGFPPLTVVDSTNPDEIARLTEGIDPKRALFIVSSKSGTTVETLSLYHYFAKLLADQGVDTPGQHFIAITDPGTPLATLAEEQGFRHLFLNAPDIGGRYSALSYFGLVPAAIIGLNVADLLARTAAMAERLKQPGADNPGLWLGTALGALAMAGRDKVTFIFDPGLDSLADWLEQLLAESTGKGGTGVVPIAHEPPAAVSAYGPDRVFVGLDLVPQPHAPTDAMLAGLATAGHPVIRLRLRDQAELGAAFLQWEVATAVAGAVLGIDPFDEPNVQESKDNTNRLLDEFRQRGSLPEPAARAAADGLAAVGNDGASPAEAIERFVAEVRSDNYLAIMAFTTRDAGVTERLTEIRRLLGERLGVATTLGYGPRFLHSTGQLYKGGPATGAFLQIVAEPQQDLPIPGADYTFGTLFRAQALGDFQALEQRRRPLLRLTLAGDPVAGLDRILSLLAPVALS